MKTIQTIAAVAVALCCSLGASAQTNKAHSAQTGLTIPKKHYADSIDFSNAPRRVNQLFPLSDQENKGGWVMLDESDEFNGTSLDTQKWYPNNPGWKGRQPTYFHESNVTVADGFVNFNTNQHGDEKLPEGYTHTAGFIVSKTDFLYGYFEAKLRPNNSPYVTGFWMTKGTKDWWTEIDICENCPGVEQNRHNLNSNVHVFRSPADQGNVTKHFDSSKTYYIPFELQKDFHTWGLEWDKDFIRFYLDGVMFREVKNTHWHQALQVNFNNESNKWFGALPDDSRPDDLYLVEYFRAWQKK